MERKDKSTIALHKETIERLAQFGQFNDSYEDVVIRLMDRAMEFQKVSES